ncbi:MAG: DUF3231 family protein [Bacillota bacterium]
MNIIQGLVQSAQKPTTNPHVGEAFHIWTLSVEVGETRALLKVMLNHTNDADLKEWIEHFIDDLLEPMGKRIREFMQNEGINAPEVSAEVAKADERLIPPGAKVSDVLLAQMLVVKVVGLLEWTHRSTVHSLRPDIGPMCNGFYNHLLTQGYTLRTLMRKRGWLHIPPYYDGGAPDQEPQ